MRQLERAGETLTSLDRLPAEVSVLGGERLLGLLRELDLTGLATLVARAEHAAANAAAHPAAPRPERHRADLEGAGAIARALGFRPPGTEPARPRPRAAGARPAPGRVGVGPAGPGDESGRAPERVDGGAVSALRPPFGAAPDTGPDRRAPRRAGGPTPPAAERGGPAVAHPAPDGGLRLRAARAGAAGAADRTVGARSDPRVAEVIEHGPRRPEGSIGALEPEAGLARRLDRLLDRVDHGRGGARRTERVRVPQAARPGSASPGSLPSVAEGSPMRGRDGGLRGLRGLVARVTDGPTPQRRHEHGPPGRVSPEPPPHDLLAESREDPLLEARLVDILRREARRHGIDLEGVAP